MTDKGMVKREYAKNVYGPLQGRTLRNVLIKKLIDGYGYSDKLEIAKRLVDDFLDTVARFAPPVDRVKPGQLVWIARSEGDKQGYGKNSADTEAKRAILSLVTEEDLDTLAKDGKVEPIKDKRMVRLINEAKQQGMVLSLADLSAIMLLSAATLSKRTRRCQKETGKLLPTAGNVLDIGRGITHKRDTAELYAKGYNAMEISRMIDHELKNVETYIVDMERVKILASKDKQTISRLTRLSTSLVDEYLEIIRTYYPESMHLNSKEENIDDVDN
jgi:hypothetical protein